MQLCDYGCGQEAKYQFKNGKWCCSKSFNSCPNMKKINRELNKGKILGPPSLEHRRKNSEANKGKILGPQSIEHKRKRSESMKGKNKGIKSKEIRKRISKGHKLTIKKLKLKYPFLLVVEELRENENGEIQGHCKHHNCENSKEKGGWFTLTYNQLKNRRYHICNLDGNGGSYLYCSQKCKDSCVLHGLQNDPYEIKNNVLPYTPGEKQVYNKIVLERENGLCEYCGEPATEVHHIFPQKLEPFFALDPDYGVACCEKHHYKYGHKDECSTDNLAKIVCSVESQKFLNQILINKNF